jgi:hypothetical protein
MTGGLPSPSSAVGCEWVLGRLAHLGDRKIIERVSAQVAAKPLDETWIPPEPPFLTHWTPKGTFKIYFGSAGRECWSILYLDERRIYHSVLPFSIAQTLAQGSYDDLIGFPTADLRIPSDLKEWNDSRVPYPGLQNLK